MEKGRSGVDNFITDGAVWGKSQRGAYVSTKDGEGYMVEGYKVENVVELDPICRQQQVNEKCFKTLDLVPKEALTLTIPALLKAEWMFCIVPFKNKAQAVYQTVYGEVSEKCPASILRRKENSSLYLDPESAERINL